MVNVSLKHLIKADYDFMRDQGVKCHAVILDVLFTKYSEQNDCTYEFVKNAVENH